LSEEAKPARKIKPPSASFLTKSKEVSPSSESMPAVFELSGEGLLGAPSVEVPADEDLFSVPAVEAEVKLDPAPTAPPT